MGEDAERLSVIMLALRHRGVDVVDPDYDAAAAEALVEPEAECLDRDRYLPTYPAMTRSGCISRKCRVSRC